MGGVRKKKSTKNEPHQAIFHPAELEIVDGDRITSISVPSEHDDDGIIFM